MPHLLCLPDDLLRHLATHHIDADDCFWWAMGCRTLRRTCGRRHFRTPVWRTPRRLVWALRVGRYAPRAPAPPHFALDLRVFPRLFDARAAHYALWTRNVDWIVALLPLHAPDTFLTSTVLVGDRHVLQAVVAAITTTNASQAVCVACVLDRLDLVQVLTSAVHLVVDPLILAHTAVSFARGDVLDHVAYRYPAVTRRRSVVLDAVVHRHHELLRRHLLPRWAKPPHAIHYAAATRVREVVAAFECDGEVMVERAHRHQHVHLPTPKVQPMGVLIDLHAFIRRTWCDLPCDPVAFLRTHSSNASAFDAAECSALSAVEYMSV